MASLRAQVIAEYLDAYAEYVHVNRPGVIKEYQIIGRAHSEVLGRGNTAKGAWNDAYTKLRAAGIIKA